MESEAQPVVVTNPNADVARDDNNDFISWWMAGTLDNRIVCVEADWLYLGQVSGRRDVEGLGIAEVISITADYEFPLAELPSGVIQHPPWMLPDSVMVEPLHVHEMLNVTHELLTKARVSGRKIFVHCAAGISRSATVVLNYWMSRDGLSFDDALQKLKLKRSCVRPNALFQAILIERHRVCV